MSEVQVRDAVRSDADALLQLMHELAVFERYVDRFRVTAEALVARGLGDVPTRQFHALVAVDATGELLGYAVVVEIAFTHDLMPTLVLKELFVRKGARGAKLGRALFEGVAAHGRTRGCPRLKWDVLPDNDAAKQFYTQLGGRLDTAWEPWTMALD
jgi:GNAT superfamily N-acetyltransferase